MGSASESTGRSSRSAPRTYGEVMDGFEHGLKRATRVWVGELEDKVMRYTPVLQNTVMDERCRIGIAFGDWMV